MSQIITYYLVLIARGMVFILIIRFFTSIKKHNFMKIVNIFKYIPVYSKKISRLFKVKHRSEIVWNELIKLHKKENWHFGQYDNEKYVRATFTDENNNDLNFHYQVTDDKLVFRAVIVSDFSEDYTNDIMVLSSHLNSLLTFGMVRVNIKDNYVEFVYQGDLLVYMLYPGEIHSDIDRHFRITSDCYWAFTHLLNSGDEPVFVISELLKRNEKRSQA